MYLTEGVSVRYMLNLKVPGGEVFVPAEGEALAFIRGVDMGYVRMQHSNVQEPLYDRGTTRDGTNPEEAQRFGQGLSDCMKGYGLAGETLGVDRLGTPGFLALTSAGIRLGDATPVIEHAGAAKTKDELTIYRVIGEQYAHTIDKFRDAIRPGISENELASIVVSAWYEAGGQGQKARNPRREPCV